MVPSLLSLPLPLWSPSHRLLPAVIWRAMPLHQATYLLPPFPNLPLLSLTVSPPVLVAPHTQRKKTFCLTNKSLLPPCVSVCVRASYFCLSVSLSLSLSLCLLWEPTEEQSAGVYVKEYRERRRRGKKQAPLSSLFSLLSLLFYILSSFFFFNTDALFPLLSLSTPGWLNYFKILCLWLSISPSLRAALILSPTHANTLYSGVFYCCDCWMNENIVGSPSMPGTLL